MEIFLFLQKLWFVGLVGVALKNRGGHDRIRSGSVAEWLKAHDSKSCGLARVSEVRILSLPPETKEESLLSYFVSEGSRGMIYPLASAKPLGLFFIHSII